MSYWEKKIITGCFLLFLIPSLFFAQDAGEYLRKGKASLRMKKFDYAIEQFSRALELQPDLAKAYLGRAEAYDSLGMFLNAASNYDSTAVYMPGRAGILYNSGYCYYRLGMFEKAAGQLNRAIDIREYFRPAYELKAVILTDQGRYDEALEIWTKVLDLKKTSQAYYERGKLNEVTGSFEEAEQDFTAALRYDRKNHDILCSLAGVELQLGKIEISSGHTNSILEKDPENICARIVKSRIYARQEDLNAAVEEISGCLVLDPGNEELYFIRAMYYHDLNQHASAVEDLTHVLSMNNYHVRALYYRALSYEDAGNYQAAVNDYQDILKLSDSMDITPELISETEIRIFYLRRETNRPEILLSVPVQDADGFITLPGGTDTLIILGELSDDSGVACLTINGQEMVFPDTARQLTFQVKINVAGSESLLLEASDIYNNVRRVDYPLIFTETQPPVIYVIAPYASEDNRIFLEDNRTLLVLEGYIEDNSLISSILINDMPVDYMPGELDPPFRAGINIAGANKIIITATDAYGNIATQHYLLNRVKASLSPDNPMGKTWVVIVENSDYQNFPDLKGPKKEVTMLRTALARYQVHNIIHKKNLTRADTEKFFSVELRDLVRSNEVVSLIIWFAGRGISVNEAGYWLPVDALPSVKYSYYNLNALKASLYSYETQLRHLLLISDACNPAPEFYKTGYRDSAMVKCDDTELVQLRSSQIFTASREPSSADNSFFSLGFTDVLTRNTAYCLPVDRIAAEVFAGFMDKNGQQPVFGTILSLSDEGGTFFFVRKD